MATFGMMGSGETPSLGQSMLRKQSPTTNKQAWLANSGFGGGLGAWGSDGNGTVYQPINQSAGNNDSGFGAAPTGYVGYNNIDGTDRHEAGQTYDQYDAEGNFEANRKFLSTKDDLKELMSYFALAAGGMQFLPGGAFGGPAGAGVGSAAGVPPPANPFVGTTGAAGGAAGGFGAGAGASGGGLLSQLGSLGGSGLGKLGMGLASLFGAGGSGGSSGGGLGGLAGALAPFLAGGVDASQQGDAAKKMLAWLNGNQAKMEGYMSPDSPEYKQMWEEMSRKDAAAGRNSQYGPRTADFLSRVAQEKAANTRMFTTGTSKAYADALNQNASKYSGLLSALGNASQGGMFGGGNNPINLSSILNAMGTGTFAFEPSGGGGSWDPNLSNDDIWDMINGGSEGFELDPNTFDISEWFL